LLSNKNNSKHPCASDPIWSFDYPFWTGEHADKCTKCWEQGELILCDGPCVGSYHLQCAGLTQIPSTDVWYCDDCLKLRKKREEIYAETKGKSSRFRPGMHNVQVWMDGDSGQANDIYHFGTFQAKCFYPNPSPSRSYLHSRSHRHHRHSHHSHNKSNNNNDKNDNNNDDNKKKKNSQRKRRR